MTAEKGRRKIYLKIAKTKMLSGTKQTINGHQESTFSKLQALRAFLKIIQVSKQETITSLDSHIFELQNQTFS